MYQRNALKQNISYWHKKAKGIMFLWKILISLCIIIHYKLPKELDHLRKDLTNIQNIDDNDWFKCCVVRYLHIADHQPARITKADKDFARKLDFKDIKFPIKIWDIYKFEKRILTPLVFLVMKIWKNIQSTY